MANLSITAASVQLVSGTVQTSYKAGEAVTAGQAVYLDTAASPNSWKLCQCDGTAIEATFGGVALHTAATGQPLAVLTPGGVVTIGATVVTGTVYVVSATYGALCPWADLVSTNKVSLVGYANTTGQLTLLGINTGVAIP